MLTDLAYIGLGSNLKEPKQQIINALQAIHKSKNICVQASSHLYQSAPMGPSDQPDYVNSVCKIATSLTPIQLLDRLQAVENSHQRERSGDKWGPRTLDLDILMFNNLTMNEERLTLPHYGMREREFVLVPLFEIEPDLIMHDGRSLTKWVSECDLVGLKRIPGKVNFESIAA